MTIAQLEKYRYWADEHGNIWQLAHYCKEPTAAFVRMTPQGQQVDYVERGLSGGITSLNLAGLKPIELPERQSDKHKTSPECPECGGPCKGHPAHE